MTMIDSALTRLAGCSADRWLREEGGADFSANFVKVVSVKFTVSRSPKVKGRLAPRVRGSVYSRSLVCFLPSFLVLSFLPNVPTAVRSGALHMIGFLNTQL